MGPTHSICDIGYRTDKKDHAKNTEQNVAGCVEKDPVDKCITACQGLEVGSFVAAPQSSLMFMKLK